MNRLIFSLWVIFQIQEKFIPCWFPEAQSMSEFTFSPPPPPYPPIQTPTSPYLPSKPVIYTSGNTKFVSCGSFGHSGNRTASIAQEE